MGELISINEIGYKFIIRAAYHRKVTNSKDELEQICLIAVQHNTLNRHFIHPFSEFVLLLKKQSYSSMKNRAETVVRFLNFILNNNNKYKLKTFADLDVNHGTDYINNLVYNKRTISYRKTEENNLTKFYYFLACKKLLNLVNKDDFKFIMNNENKHPKAQYLESFFPEAEHSGRKRSNRHLHTMESELLVLFLETAKVVTPRIALGVYFQVMGGLRASEVCNCTRTGNTLYGMYGEFGVDVRLQNQNFTKKPQRNATHVKKPRMQSIEVFHDYLPKLYKKHIENYLPSDGTLALFADRNGQAMTFRNYVYYFGKLKEAFIKNLEKSLNPKLQAYAITLKAIKWGTHIGRGIFSNIVSEITQSPIITKIKRGDSNIKSQEPYMENTATRKRQSAEALDKMYEEGYRLLKGDNNLD